MADVLTLTGLAGMTVGLWLISPAASLSVLGAVLLLAGITSHAMRRAKVRK